MRNFHTKRRVIVALLFCLSWISCVKHHYTPCAGPGVDLILCSKDFERVTVVNKTGLDGCGFMLQRADSSLFEVDNMPDSLKIEGQKICIKYHVAKQQMSVCMAGKRIELLEVKLRR